MGQDRPEEGPVGGAAGNGDVDWNEGSECSGSETGQERKLTPGQEVKNSGECHLLRHGDVAGVSALKGEFEGAHVN